MNSRPKSSLGYIYNYFYSNDNKPTTHENKSYYDLTPQEKANICKQATLAVEEVGPRLFIASGIDPDEPIRCVLIGCPGGGDAGQQDVANLFAELVKNPKTKPHFAIFPGDFIYKNGANSPDDPAFETHIHQKYGFLIKAGIPIFCAVGNHDRAQYELNRVTDDEKKGEVVAINLAGRTYHVLNSQDKTVEELKNLFLRGIPIEQLKHQTANENSDANIPISQFPLLNLPNYFYALGFKGREDKYIFLDSNTLLRDYYNLIKQNSSKKINQILWLQEIWQQCNVDKTTIVMHHPFTVSGKRARPSEYDAEHYITQEMKDTLNDILTGKDEIPVDSHEQLLSRLFRHLDITPKIRINAHEHFNNIQDDGKTIQLTSGAGGSKHLEPRESFLQHPSVKHHFSGYGLMMLRGSQVEVYMCDGRKNLIPDICYSLAHHTTIYHSPVEVELLKLRQGILGACDYYLTQLKKFEITKLERKNQNRSSTSHQVAEQLGGKTASLTNTLLSKEKVSYATYHTHRVVGKSKSKLKEKTREDENHYKEIDAIHKFINYFHKPKLSPYTQSLEELRDIEISLPQGIGSFYNYLQTYLTAKEIPTIENLLDKAYEQTNAYVVKRNLF